MMKFSSPRIITNPDYHYTSGYFTTNKFLATGELLLVRSHNPSIGNRPYYKADACELVACNPETGKLRYLSSGIIDFAFASAVGNRIFYSDGHSIIKQDARSLSQKTLYTLSAAEDILLDPHPTLDGRHISFYTINKTGSHFYVLHLESGKAEHYCDKRFAPPFTEANHGMICPTDPTRLFFAHEGITYYVSNRLWLYDHKIREAHAIAHQNMDDEGNLGDCFGHEMWAPDGKGLYFVKYCCSPTPPRGICYVDADTRRVDLLYSAFNYWHVGVSIDGNYLTSDTQPGGPGSPRSEVIVINRKTGEEALVCTVPITGSHPCHPHPQLSPDNRYLVYTALTDSGRTAVFIHQTDL